MGGPRAGSVLCFIPAGGSRKWIGSTNAINEKIGSICVPNEMPPKPGKGWHGYQLGAGDKEDLAVVVC